MENDKKRYIADKSNELKKALHEVLHVRDIPLALARLMFIKYALDNYIGADNVEKMQKYAQAQKMLAMRDTTGLSAIIVVLEYLDRAYGMDLILSSPGVITQYQASLFSANHINQKRNISDDNYRNIMGILGSIDLQETNSDDHSLGVILVSFLLAEITNEQNSILGREEAYTTTSREMNILVKRLLKVSGNDTFCDITAGLGVSTIDITGDSKPRVKLVDVNNNYLAIAAMLLIISGYKEMKVVCKDTLRNKVSEIHGNKMFVDPPLGLRIRGENESKYNESSLIIVDEVMNTYLDDNGVAVVAVPSGFLFKTDKPSKELREELVNNGHVKAVIALPPMWMRTSIGTNLLVLTKEKQKDTLLIEASGDRRKNLTNEMIESIIDSIENHKEVESFSRIVNSDEVKERGYNLVPAGYISVEAEDEIMSLEEIDKELKRLYKLLPR